MMLAVLQWIYGPNAASDPYYQLLHDFVVLMPWWYPYMWLGIIGSVIGWRLLRRWRLRRQNRLGLRRVRSRVSRFGSGPAVPALTLEAANDDVPPPIARRRAVD
jgi:hypothetical protein